VGLYFESPSRLRGFVPHISSKLRPKVSSVFEAGKYERHDLRVINDEHITTRPRSASSQFERFLTGHFVENVDAL
jgi:hypothetical protein